MNATQILDRYTRDEIKGMLLGVAATALMIILIFFKFIPDIGTAFYQGHNSSLSNWSDFESYYLKPNSVFFPRFLGNYTLYGLASLFRDAYHTNDLRLHPLRLAATILTVFYFIIGFLPVLMMRRQIDWRAFLCGYGPMTIAGLYVFYPGDSPSLAFLSIGIAALLCNRLGVALVCMLITGLFRESSFHFVILVFFWSLSQHERPMRVRAGWTIAFAVFFVIEFEIVRHYFPGPIKGAGFMLQILLRDPLSIFTGGGFWSLTTIVTLAFGMLFPLGYASLKMGRLQGWHERFFFLNCLAFPCWIIFYRMQGGNISEFRMLWPVILPYVYGLAWRTKTVG
jgi:hypothetical protein